MNDNELGQRQHGPGWADCKMMIKEVSRSHNCSIEVHWHVVQVGDEDGPTTWTVAAREWGAKDGTGPLCMLWHNWPSRAHRTVPGMLFNLLHVLDSKLTEVREQKAKARQLTF